MRKLLILCLCSLLTQVQSAQNPEFEFKLYELPDVVFRKIDVPVGYRAAYELRIKQLVDHADSAKGYFYQRVFLSHKSEEKPTVLITEGYDKSTNKICELSRLLNANQIVVEHRYFGQSTPDEMDYNYLNLEQATADLHYINKLFRKIYKGKWISSGISKGGQTTLYYRYFYPNDVDVSVPYVAPFNLSLEEERIYNFLDTIGSSACRGRIEQVQRRILENREEAIKYIRWYSYGAALSFTYHSLEEAFEYTVLEYPFSFWQWGYSCEDIPTGEASLEETLAHLLSVSNIDFYADDDIEKYGSHYYQAATEMGYYGYRTEKFKEHIKVLPVDSNPLATFVPDKIKVSFDGTLAQDVYNWLMAEGENIIYIYGSRDTWTATAIPPSENCDSEWFFMKGKGHAEARIKNMTDEEETRLIQTLERWLGIEINPLSASNWYKLQY